MLRELGDRKLLATKYRRKDKYLIGPKYFDNYFSVLKIVCLSIIIGIPVAFGVTTIFSVKGLAELIGGYTGSLLSALSQGVVWVTGRCSTKFSVDDSLWAVQGRLCGVSESGARKCLKNVCPTDYRMCGGLNLITKQAKMSRLWTTYC